MNKTTENILEVNQSMIDASISNLRFDQTEIATITKVLEEGYYQVFNGKVKYQARVLNDSKYSENEQVYVTIKEGDYSLEKTIIGKYVIDKPEEKISVYEDPFDRLAINQTLIVLENDENKWEYDDENNQWKIDDKLDFSTTGLGQPTYFGSNVSVETDGEISSQGSFGLKVELKDKDGELINSISIESQYFVGNIYKLTPDLKHKNIYRLPDNFNVEKIKSITVTPFKEGFNKVDWYDIILYFGYDNKDSKISSSTDKVFIDTNTGFNVYNARKTVSEVFNKDLEAESNAVVVKPRTTGNGEYNDSNKGEPRWDFYNYDGKEDNINWKNKWQHTCKFTPINDICEFTPINDEEALRMNMPPIEDNTAFHLYANSTFLAYPLELANIQPSQYRNCFGFVEVFYSDKEDPTICHEAPEQDIEDGYAPGTANNFFQYLMNIKDNKKVYTHYFNHIDESTRGSTHYHFKVNLETEEEKVDQQDRVIGPIDSDYIDFKITAGFAKNTETQKTASGSLRIDAPRRDLNHSNYKTLVEFNSNDSRESEYNIILRYYSKNSSLSQNFTFSSSSQEDSTDYYETTTITDANGQSIQYYIIHIPYGALVWFEFPESDPGTHTVIKSDYPLEDKITQPLTARVKFNHFVSIDAIYKNDYFANRVGVYKVSLDDFNSTIPKYFKEDSQKIGITNLYETMGEWSEYQQDFIVDYGYKYYIGLAPVFGGFGGTQNDVVNPNIYIDNLSLYTLEAKELTTLYGTWIKDNNVYSKLNLPPADKLTILEWYQKTPNYPGESDGIGPWWKKIVKEISIENGIENPNYKQAWNLEVDKYLSNNPDETFKFVIKRDEETYISEDLVLINEGYSTPRATTESEGLKFTINDDGIYLYDYTGNLYNNEGTNKILTAAAIAGETELNENDIIAWLIPKNSTMLREPQLIVNETEINGTPQKEYYWECLPEKTYDIEPKLEDFNLEVQGTYSTEILNSYYIIEKKCTQDNLSLSFKIKTLFQPNAINNDILVYVFDGDNLLSPKYKASKFTPKFIATNNVGAEGSLGIELVSEKGYLGADNTEDIELKATVYDSTGTPVDLQPTITWETGGAPSEIYDGYWANGESGKQISVNTIEVYKPDLQYQVHFKANNYSSMSNSILINEYPKIYSIKFKKEADTVVNNKLVSGKMIQLKQDLCREQGEQCLWTDLYMLSENYLNPDNKSWENYPNLGAGTIYFLTNNQELTVHYVYDNIDERPDDFPNPNEFKTEINPIEDPYGALSICNIYKSFTFNNETKVREFTPFNFEGNGAEGSEFQVVLLTDENKPAAEKRYAYVLNKGKDKEIKDVYIRVPHGNSSRPGAMPYVNFVKTGNDPAPVKFQMNYLPKGYNSQDENNISTENNTLILSSNIEMPLIIKAKCEWQRSNEQKVQLSSYYTIPYFPTNQKYDLEGNTKISYSAFGTNPIIGEKYQVYSVTNKGRENINNYFFETTSINGQIKSEDKMIIDNNDNTTGWYHNLSFPQIAPAEEEIGTLDIYVATEWIKEGSGSKIPKKDGLEPIAKFPLILYRNSYAFKEINNWNSTSTDVQDTYIISPMIAAGTKNNDNQFTGVMMGTHTNFPSTGLYGFKDGIATFGFKEDGSCFIGANEETGRIEFNTGENNNLKIISKNFDLQTGITVSTTAITGTGIRLYNNGLYGYKNGIATFGFNNNGSCFIGADNQTGKIEFNGNNLSIVSKNFELQAINNGTGIRINNSGLYGYQNSIATFGFRQNGSCFIGSEDKATLNFDINEGLNLYAGNFKIYANKITQGNSNLVMSVDSENGLLLNGNLDINNTVEFFDRTSVNQYGSNTHKGTFRTRMGKDSKGEMIFTLYNPGTKNFQQIDKERTATLKMGYQEKILDTSWPLNADLFQIKAQSQANAQHSLRLGVYDGDYSVLSFVCSAADQSHRYLIESSKVSNTSDNGTTSFIVLHPTEIYIGTKNGYILESGGRTRIHNGIYISQDDVQIWKNGVKIF